MVDIKKTAQLAIVGLTDPALGIITNVAYDFFKNKIDKALRPNFEKIYEETLNLWSYLLDQYFLIMI